MTTSIKYGRGSKLKPQEIINLERYIDKKIKNSSNELFEIFNKHSRKLNDVESQIDNLKQQLNKNETDHKEMSDKIDNISTSLTEIINVRVNGCVGFKEVITQLYRLTADKRTKKKFIDSAKEFINNRPILKGIFATKIGLLVIILVGIFMILSVLSVLGVPVNPVMIIKTVSGPILKYLVGN